MKYRCANPRCPHYVEPCELEVPEYNRIAITTTPCPIGEEDMFELVDETAEFFCMVIGSRDYNNYEELCNLMDKILSKKANKHITILSGGAQGADSLAEKYARSRGYTFICFEANWNEGKSAGYKRNRRMHKYISLKEDRGVVAFWDGESNGTAHSFELAKEYGNQMRIYNYKEKRFIGVMGKINTN